MRRAVLLKGQIKTLEEWVFHSSRLPRSRDGPEIKNRKRGAPWVIPDTCSRGMVVVGAENQGLAGHTTEPCGPFELCFFFSIEEELVHHPLLVVDLDLLFVFSRPTSQERSCLFHQRFHG